MKIYTFKVKNNNNDNINNLKNNIYNSYSNKYSWWNTLKYNTEKDYYNFLKDYEVKHYKPETTFKFVYNSNPFSVLLNNKYVGYLPIEEDDYDLLINGIPVKVYDTFIQYGYKIIPFTNADLYHTPKKTITEIIIKITKYI